MEEVEDSPDFWSGLVQSCNSPVEHRFLIGLDRSTNGLLPDCDRKYVSVRTMPPGLVAAKDTVYGTTRIRLFQGTIIIDNVKRYTLKNVVDLPTVEVVELWTVFHEHYSLLGQSSIMGRCISTDHRFAYKDCSVCRSSHFYEAVYFCRFEIRMGNSMLSHFSFIFP